MKVLIQNILKFYHKHAMGEVMVLIQIVFVSSLYISVTIKVKFLRFNMFNRYNINNSKLVLVFF